MADQTEAAVIIVGAGPSGLATAACLHELSIPYTLLERQDCFAPLWQKYSYDRVHLHLPKQFCQLPLMPIPPSYPKYLPRNEFVQYLNDYVSRFGISPRYWRSVETASYDEVAGKWKITAQNLGSGEAEEYTPRFLVVATGETCDPKIPEVEGLHSFTGEVLHSTEYRNGGKFAGERVLVIGSGNSGMEIALDLANSGAKTSIVVRSPVRVVDGMQMHIMSRGIAHAGLILLKYLPLKWVDWFLVMMSKCAYGDLSKYGIQTPKEGPFALKINYGKYPVLDVGTLNKLINSREIQIHILSRGMMDAAVELLKYFSFEWVEWITIMMSKAVFGDLTKYGMQRPEEGPFTVKLKYGKFPVIDVGTFNKIKSGEIQVLPAGIRSIKGNTVVLENENEHMFDVIVFATGFKRSTKQWLKGEDVDSLLNDDGLAKSFPNQWKGKKGLYCVGLAQKGLYGAGMDAQNIARDIKALL
ncbi:UNVERIFIED_CONTAM: putative indole-3-pyruvate monooxygenase YUCCA10 [Sesamum latifolium]|uniref:indole-3-pyruvate monooxygenase n=1 Tax=Sesamum latifolium TaxID=2727402 RepID=A0AAW2Y1K6_9LAMI